jgi:quercetin dioxygenase-like cupin family protein
MKLSNYNKALENLEKIIIESNIDGTYGDGETLVNNEDFPIEHEFSDQLYMRKMKMKAGSIVISAIHETEHFWFLLKGRILVCTDGETVEHIAPCYTKSEYGAKRLIKCIEDCLFINVHKNPSNTQDLNEIEKNIYSMSWEEHHNKKNI